MKIIESEGGFRNPPELAVGVRNWGSIGNCTLILHSLTISRHS